MTEKTNEPLVSVIIPVYNGERYLEEALQSVVDQSYSRLEVVMVDDGSTDRSADIARSFEGLNCLSQTNQGPAVARNAAISIATGDLITFIDADDIWPENRIRTQVDFMTKNPGIGFAFGRCLAFLEPGTVKPPWLSADALEGKQVGYFPGTLVITREALDTVGGFNPKLHVGEGAEWFIRAKESQIPMDVIDEVLLHRRIHSSNLTHQGDQINLNILAALKQSLDRKRQGRAADQETDE